MTNTLATSEERPAAIDPHSGTYTKGRWHSDALQPSDFTTPEDQFGEARRIMGAAIAILAQGEDLLRALSAEAYTHRVPLAFNACIGGHYRHCLDHFTSLLRALDADEVDYDHRERDVRIESQPDFALRLNPFRLIGVFPIHKAAIEWRWNLKRLERFDHHWRTNTWISSGFDEPGAQEERGKAFDNALRQNSVETADWLCQLHRSHIPEPSPYSTCMHRQDAATVSYTEVRVSLHKATMRYTPGAPCCTPTGPPIRLQLRR